MQEQATPASAGVVVSTRGVYGRRRVGVPGELVPEPVPSSVPEVAPSGAPQCAMNRLSLAVVRSVWMPYSAASLNPCARARVEGWPCGVVVISLNA